MAIAKKLMSGRAVFLDRDGTIAPDVPYCSRPEDFNLYPDAAEAIALLNKQGFKVVVITNQSGIARGYFTEQTLTAIHTKMEAKLALQGARVDAIYYCPHQPADDCDCRKPKTALFHKAAADLSIDLRKSYVIGDMPLDIEAGRSLGCRTVLVNSKSVKGVDAVNSADYLADNLLNAARWVVNDAQ